jgi:hypothetical protein
MPFEQRASLPSLDAPALRVVGAARFCGFIMDHETRTLVLEPALYQMHADHLRGRRQHRWFGASTVLGLFWALRVGWTFLGCFVGSKTVQDVVRLVRKPQGLRPNLWIWIPGGAARSRGFLFLRLADATGTGDFPSADLAETVR